MLASEDDNCLKNKLPFSPKLLNPKWSAREPDHPNASGA
jgi:hypothetical protein